MFVIRGVTFFPIRFGEAQCYAGGNQNAEQAAPLRPYRIQCVEQAADD